MDSPPTNDSSPYHIRLPEWPRLGIGRESVDGLVPVCRLRDWRRLEAALAGDRLNPKGAELIFRGQRRHEWQLTPSLGRYSKPGVVDEKRALEQRREFRLAMR